MSSYNPTLESKNFKPSESLSDDSLAFTGKTARNPKLDAAVSALEDALVRAALPPYNHAFDFAFEVDSESEIAEDVTGAMLRHELLRRISSLSDADLPGACNRFDTYAREIDEEDT